MPSGAECAEGYAKTGKTKDSQNMLVSRLISDPVLLKGKFRVFQPGPY